MYFVAALGQPFIHICVTANCELFVKKKEKKKLFSTYNAQHSWLWELVQYKNAQFC